MKVKQKKVLLGWLHSHGRGDMDQLIGGTRDCASSHGAKRTPIKYKGETALINLNDMIKEKAQVESNK